MHRYARLFATVKLIAAGLIASTSTSCSIYAMRVHTPDELVAHDLPAPIAEKEADPWAFIAEVAASGSRSDFQSEPEPIRHVRENGKVREVEQVEEGKPILAFVHLSDVQLRDERARLWAVDGSNVGDLILPFEHDEMQMRYDYAVYLAAISELNALRARRLAAGRRDAPQFVVHTGDSLEAATSQEMIEFLALTDRFELPFLQAIGNHDINVFGNFEGKQIYLGNPMAGNLVINGEDEFVLWHRNGLPTGGSEEARAVEASIRARHFGEIPLTAEPEGWQPHAATVDFFGKHGLGGFDAGHGIALERNLNDDDRSRPYYVGYYAVSLRRPIIGEELGTPTWQWTDENSAGVRLIVLNTYETLDTEFGSWHQGRMSDEQLAWLTTQIEEATSQGEKVMVFGHHNLEGFASKDTGKVLEAAFEHPAVIAYFAGHTHKYDIKEHDGFWEVITAGLVEYPQRPSIVTLQELADGRLAIDVQALEILPGGEAPTDCPTVNTKDLKRAALCGKAGAMNDLSKKNLWERIKAVFSDPSELDDSKRNTRLMVAQ